MALLTGQANVYAIASGIRRDAGVVEHLRKGNDRLTAYMPEKRLVDPLTGRQERVALPQRTFTEIRDDLLRDSEVLPAAGPLQPTREYLRALDRKQLVVQSADAEGNVRHQVLTGDTEAGWAAKDLLERMRRG